MATGSENVFSARVEPDLRRQIESLQAELGLESRSDIVRLLLVRGLFIERKPNGPWREAAFKAAYFNYLAQFWGVVRSMLLGTPMQELVKSGMRQLAKNLDFTDISADDLS